VSQIKFSILIALDAIPVELIFATSVATSGGTVVQAHTELGAEHYLSVIFK